ncbi:hypothetical protein LC085_00480 [Bacillus tianshenii]|uniref:hypothetical protein n=1 Tax=Sutcliffiella tianshenii TaxID=1463404 RepID=UPI001CD46103|nr:hypothetical protein [Bacillus tianshenii]MCA1318370.1 hypothetical protein [Bacillus tianshenii]
MELKKNNGLILREVDCWQGRADIVEGFSNDIYTSINTFSDEQILLIRNLTCAKIISLLNHTTARTKKLIYNNLGIQKKTIDVWLVRLLEEEILAETRPDRFIIHPNFSLPEIKFTAYEVKLYNWKRALYQATQYKGFSNKSYVVMPKKHIQPAINNLQAFVANNIGLIEVNDDGRFKILLKSRNLRPTSKAFNIIGKGIALYQLKNSRQMNHF